MRFFFYFTACFAVALAAVVSPAQAAMEDKEIAVLQSLDKITARTQRFEVGVGKTVKFGTMYIRVRACRQAPPVETPESAAFLQIWEEKPDEESQWVFSGWMFASSPALSAMDHAIYDVWVTDCRNSATSTDSGEGEGDPDIVPPEGEEDLDVRSLFDGDEEKPASDE